ncbi:hypothetical protein MPS_4677 [Mycobacterium pseudoshottsii JCM 15466]|nr:hypothetical protein MPS_4677 [Mycobacterium pseudoshottsii JCM 15466]
MLRRNLPHRQRSAFILVTIMFYPTVVSYGLRETARRRWATR